MWCARGRCAGDGWSRGGGQVATWDIIMVLKVVDDDDGVVGGHDDVVGDDNEVPYGIHQNDDKNVEGK